MEFARRGARFRRDFELLVAWLPTMKDKHTLRLVGIDWHFLGQIRAVSWRTRRLRLAR